MQNRKIILNLCTSLDGFVEGANGEIDWCLTDQDYGMTSFLQGIDTICIGRKSYEQLMQMMPEGFPGKEMLVFSTTLKDSDVKGRVIGGDIKKEVKALLSRPGKDIWLFGGAQLVTSFINLQLVDEMMIAVHPLLLGEGKPLFSGLLTRSSLQLVEAKTFSSGLVQLIYTF